jgi:SNF2 family DNA or RNA helicase
MENPKSKLTKCQLEVYRECIRKGSGGLSLVMGYGKTIISIVLSLRQQQKLGSNVPILVVCSKTLIESWIYEIKKFFGSDLKFEVLHKNYMSDIDSFQLKMETKLILTTPEVLTKAYKEYNIEDKFTKKVIQNEGKFNQHYIKCYRKDKVKHPFLSKKIGIANIFSTKWSSLVVDEVQKYTNINNIRCQAMGAICSHYRWVLSGTMFSEPIIERILGYYVIIQDSEFPNNIPGAKKFVDSSLFRGFDETIIQRKENPSFIKPVVNQQIVSHNLSKEEEVIYKSMKIIFNMLESKKQKAKAMKNKEKTKELSSVLLTLLGYLRQSLVCPVLPLKNTKSILSKKLVIELEKQGLSDWLNNDSCIKSTRFKEALRVVDKHQSENIVIFSSFRKCLTIFEDFLPKDRKRLTISSNMSSEERFKVLEDFSEGDGNILLLTYDIGAEGLNLQSSNTVILLDFFWNDGKTQQAIARVLRYGQVSPIVNIYMFTGNTAIEKAIFEKHDSKLNVIDELSQGRPITKVTRMKIEDIIAIINKEDNINAIKKVHKELKYDERSEEEKIILLKRKLYIATKETEFLNILKIKEIFKEMARVDVTRRILKKSDILSLLRYLRDDNFPSCKVQEYSSKIIDHWKKKLQK